MLHDVHGILLLDKPPGLSSNGVLQRVKHLFCAKKAGHTGSLDPIATGMLPICFGDATKFSQYLLDSNKTYRVLAKLGLQTTTGDIEGEVISTLPVPSLDIEKVLTLFKKLTGPTQQVPPMFSALKHQGKPLYELARQGIEVERKARSITIFSLELLALHHDLIEFTVFCSKGTYVRTLVEEIGRQLGCGAHVQALRRLAVTPYENQTMHSLSALTDLAEQKNDMALQALLLPIETSVQSLREVSLSASTAYYLRLGQTVRIPNLAGLAARSLVRLNAENYGFLGIGEILGDGSLKPHRLRANKIDCTVA